MGKFFHIQKAKKFSYNPIYYNEQAEKRAKRNKIIMQELEAEKNGQKPSVTKQDLENYFQISRKAQKKSNTRLLVILAILTLLFYFMIYN